MSNAKSLKKALICSVMVLALCFTMLLGTTLAWFTDSVTNNVNQIVSGNLDVELKHSVNYSGDSTQLEVVEGNTKLYDNLVWSDDETSIMPTIWQPNTKALEYYEIENNGTLPLRFKFTINFSNATSTLTGKTLADVLVLDAKLVNGEDLVEGGTYEGESTLKNYVYEGSLAVGEVCKILTNITWTQSSLDNEFNVEGGLKISFGVSLVATQTNPNATFPQISQGTIGEDDNPNESLDDPTLEGIVVNNLTSDIVINASNAYLDFGGENTEKIIINGNGHKITLDTTYWSRLNLANPAAVLVINDATLTSTQSSGTWNSYDVTFMCNVELNNVKLEKALALNNGINAKLKNVEITETNGDYYGMWICAGANVEIDGLKITTNVDGGVGRGIKIDDEYLSNPNKTYLSIKNATFVTAKKGAIIVKSSAGAEITVGENVNIEGCVADSENVVWVDSNAADTFDIVIVNGATKYLEA